MTTLPPPSIKEYPDDSDEKKIYNFIDSLEEYLPLMNDRARLSFALLNFIQGKGDPPNITVRNNKLTIEKITQSELIKIIEERLKQISDK
jgi:hypothetical protein